MRERGGSTRERQRRSRFGHEMGGPSPHETERAQTKPGPSALPQSGEAPL